MDFIIFGILAICYLLLKLFADWCERQIERS